MHDTSQSKENVIEHKGTQTLWKWNLSQAQYAIPYLNF
jgi:hypothetical protein